MAWAALELVTEVAIWGILDLDMKHGPLVTWRLDMKMRWALLLQQAAKHLPSELPFLKTINKNVEVCTRDRNIIVHGLVQVMLYEDNLQPVNTWTVYKGSDAGKFFIVDETSTAIIRDNIQSLVRKMHAFNLKHGFHPKVSPKPGNSQVGWPKPLS